MKWIKASERLPQEYTDLHIKWTDPSSTDNVVKCTGHFDGMDSFNVIGTSEQLPIEEIEWLDETQSVTNEGASTATLEELENKVAGVINNFEHGLHRRVAQQFWDELRHHLLAILAGKYNGETAVDKWTREYMKEYNRNIELQARNKELEEALSADMTREYNDSEAERTWPQFRDQFLEQIQDLQSQLKEKDEKNFEVLYSLGKFYGYPRCCIDAFVLDARYGGNGPSERNIDGSGFIPCSSHYKQIKSGKIKIEDLIDNRACAYQFPKDHKLGMFPLSTTIESQLGNSREEAIGLLKEYEQWEADLIAEDSCWWPHGKDMPPKLYNKMMDLQAKRNKILQFPHHEHCTSETEEFMRYCNLMATYREMWPRYLQSKTEQINLIK